MPSGAPMPERVAPDVSVEKPVVVAEALDGVLGGGVAAPVYRPGVIRLRSAVLQRREH